jgi:hypothetical protein
MVLKASDTPFLMDDGTWVVSHLNPPPRVPEMLDSVIPRTWGPDPLPAAVVILYYIWSSLRALRVNSAGILAVLWLRSLGRLRSLGTGVPGEERSSWYFQTPTGLGM